MFELWATTEGSRREPLVNGMTLVSGDRVELSARVSEDAHIYLFFCDANRQLTRFPREGSFSLRGQPSEPRVTLDTALRLDQNVGKEVLYVLASRQALEQADPRLKAALDAARPGEPALDCGGTFARAIVGAKPAGPKPSRPAKPPLSKPKPLAAELVRGVYAENRSSGSVSAASGEDGIVVLRYSYEHR